MSTKCFETTKVLLKLVCMLHKSEKQIVNRLLYTCFSLIGQFKTFYVLSKFFIGYLFRCLMTHKTFISSSFPKVGKIALLKQTQEGYDDFLYLIDFKNQ
jgi:hypothetical protein